MTSLAQLNAPLTVAGPLDCTPTIAAVQHPMSNLVFTGPCAFVERAGVPCVRKVDDFYVYIRHQLPNGGQLVVTVNVEKYKGPGDYAKATQIDMEVARGTDLFPWVQFSASSTVAPDGRHVTLARTDVPPQSGTSALGTVTIGGEVYCST